MKPPTILFVDDEPIIRRISARLLKSQFPTIEAGSVDEALEILKQNRGDIGVIITDINMPDVSGMVLIDKASGLYPDISIVASTGDLSKYDIDSLIAEGKLFHALEKPWVKDRALKIVKQAMDAFLAKSVQ